MIFLFILGISVKMGAHTVYEVILHDLSLFSCKHSKCFDSKVATVSDRMHTDSTSGTMAGY
jgi:hypothetical protein